MGALSYSVLNLQSQLNDPRVPLNTILHLTRDVLEGLEYLHNECGVVYSGTSYALFAIIIGCSYCPADLKPGNILLLLPDLDRVVMHELSEQLATLYGFPKVVPPNKLPVHLVMSAPLLDLDPDQGNKMHWVIVDLGHGVLT
jgi:serine/threonine-protein kinase SRPK3